MRNLRPILVLFRKEVIYFRRDRASMVLTFLVPFFFIYLFGQIFGVNRSDPGPAAVPLAVVDESGSAAGAGLMKALRAEPAFQVVTEVPGPKGGLRPLTEADLRPLIRENRFRFALVLPRDLTGGRQAGLHVVLLDDPRNAIETQMVTGLLEKTIFTEVPRLLGASLQNQSLRAVGAVRLDRFDRTIANASAETFGGNPDRIYRSIQAGNFGAPASGAGAGTLDSSEALSRMVRIDQIQVVGKNVRKPLATQLVGGWAIQFLLFAVFAVSTSLFHEKDFGIFQRVLAGPVPRSAILWSKFLYGMALGLLQLLILFFAGWLLFGIEVLPHLAHLAIVCLFAAAACAAFGMVLAALARTPEAARGLATFAILTMSALGGAWFPVSIMPEFMQRVSRVTLVYWSIEGFLQVLWAHASFVELLPTLGILAGMTALFLAFAWWRFDRGAMFD
ncbi:MAG: ABC transporter permease [Opitutaceae bacterium]